MKLIITLLLAGSLGFLNPTADKHRLRIKIEDVRSNTGTLNIAVYQEQHDFLSDDDVYTALKVKAKQPFTLAELDLPPGRYAVAIYQDLDMNDKMEKNFLGIPKEPVGLSNDAIKGMSRPQFSDASFEVNTDKTVVVDLKHY